MLGFRYFSEINMCLLLVPLFLITYVASYSSGGDLDAATKAYYAPTGNTNVAQAPHPVLVKDITTKPEKKLP